MLMLLGRGIRRSCDRDGDSGLEAVNCSLVGVHLAWLAQVLAWLECLELGSMVAR